MTTTDTTPVASEVKEAPAKEAAAKETTVVAEGPVKPRELSNLTDKQYADWRLTGEIPAEAQAEKKAEEKVSADEKAAPAKKEKAPGSMGYGELRAKIAELEAKIAAGEKPKAADEAAAKKEAKTETRAKKPTPNDVTENGEPRFATYEDYVDALTDWKTDEKLAAFKSEASKESEAKAKDAEIAQVNKQIEEMWKAKVNEARKKYADFDEFALNKDLPVKAGSVVDAWCLDSEIGAEILYHFGKNPKELDKINAMSPFAAAREMTRLEDKLSSSSAGASEVKKAIEEVKATRTPPPAREVGGRGTAAVDEVSKAVADDDVRGYINSANRREIASRTR